MLILTLNVRTELWRTPSLSRSVVESTRSSSTDSEETIDQSREAILGRVDLILGQALSWSSYKEAVAKYRDYMNWNKLDQRISHV